MIVISVALLVATAYLASGIGKGTRRNLTPPSEPAKENQRIDLHSFLENDNDVIDYFGSKFIKEHGSDKISKGDVKESMMKIPKLLKSHNSNAVAQKKHFEYLVQDITNLSNMTSTYSEEHCRNFDEEHCCGNDHGCYWDGASCNASPYSGQRTCNGRNEPHVVHNCHCGKVIANAALPLDRCRAACFDSKECKSFSFCPTCDSDWVCLLYDAACNGECPAGHEVYNIPWYNCNCGKRIQQFQNCKHPSMKNYGYVTPWYSIPCVDFTTLSRCRQKCNSVPDCKSFGLWTGPEDPGYCALFDEECPNGPCEDPTGQGWENVAYNKDRDVMIVQSSRNCNCGDRIAEYPESYNTVEKCRDACMDEPNCKSFGLWSGSGFCALYGQVCNILCDEPNRPTTSTYQRDGIPGVENVVYNMVGKNVVYDSVAFENCNCGNRVNQYPAGSNQYITTVEQCGYECVLFGPRCKSFGFWTGSESPGYCALFDAVCTGECGNPTSVGYENVAYNVVPPMNIGNLIRTKSDPRLVGYDNQLVFHNCNCGTQIQAFPRCTDAQKRQIHFGYDLRGNYHTRCVDYASAYQCAKKCLDVPECKSFGFWTGHMAVGRCVLFDNVCTSECPDPTGATPGWENNAYNIIR